VKTVIEQEKAEFLGFGTLVQRSRKPAAALFEFRLEHVAMENATVDQGSRGLFFKVASIALDKMPAATGEELIGSWDGSFPMLFSVGVVIGAITVLEPICGATEGAQAEEEVWGHDRRWQ
jgi:hypothetical protein